MKIYVITCNYSTRSRGTGNVRRRGPDSVRGAEGQKHEEERARQCKKSKRRRGTGNCFSQLCVSPSP